MHKDENVALSVQRYMNTPIVNPKVGCIYDPPKVNSSAPSSILTCEYTFCFFNVLKFNEKNISRDVTLNEVQKINLL